ncbi:hypothetical protein JB92DRAFT_3023869, partial [Gautieria morchelliformis]
MTPQQRDKGKHSHQRPPTPPSLSSRAPTRSPREAPPCCATLSRNMQGVAARRCRTSLGGEGRGPPGTHRCIWFPDSNPDSWDRDVLDLVDTSAINVDSEVIWGTCS